MLQAEAETKMVQSKCQKYTDMCKLENTELFRFLLKESEDKIGVNMKEHVENHVLHSTDRTIGETPHTKWNQFQTLNQK